MNPKIVFFFYELNSLIFDFILIEKNCYSDFSRCCIKTRPQHSRDDSSRSNTQSCGIQSSCTKGKLENNLIFNVFILNKFSLVQSHKHFDQICYIKAMFSLTRLLIIIYGNIFICINITIPSHQLFSQPITGLGPYRYGV